MIIIGITGSIGMGKTTVSSMLRFLGIPVFDSDKEVREILDKNVDVKNEIFKIWPKAMYIEQKEKKINKIFLSDKVFKKKRDKEKLERIIHPLVEDLRISFIKQNHASYIIGLDVPLLYETGTDKVCNYIFLTNTSKKNQKKRVLLRQNMTEEKFNLINNSQWSFERKKNKKPFLISTSYGKLYSFINVLFYLLVIIFKEQNKK